MRRFAAIAALSLALVGLSACADLDGYGDYGGRGQYGYQGYRPAPAPYWGPGFVGQPYIGHRGGFYGGGRGAGGNQVGRPAAPPPRMAPQPAVGGPVMQGGRGRSYERKEQGAN